MFKTFCRYWIGYLRIEIQGTSPERFMNMCIHHHIEIWNLEVIGILYSFNILQTQFKELRPIIKKTKVKTRIVERHGLPFFMFKNRKRKAFAIGLCSCFIAIFLMSQYIWHISISGNEYYTKEHIIEFLNDNEIQILMLADEVNTDLIVSMIRMEFPYIVWASVHVDGSELIIKVKENDHILENGFVWNSEYKKELLTEVMSLEVTSTDSDDISNYSRGIDIIAAESGTIESIITRAGEPMVHIGDYVEKGEILVSGCLEIYDDYGSIISYNYVSADADIKISTTYNYSDSISLGYIEKEYMQETDKVYYLKVGSYYIGLGDWNDLEESYDIIQTEWTLEPEQQSFLNLRVGCYTQDAYIYVEKIYTDEEIIEILNSNFQLYSKELSEKKVDIIENDVNIYIDKINASATGTLNVIYENSETAITEVREEPVVIDQEG